MIEMLMKENDKLNYEGLYLCDNGTYLIEAFESISNDVECSEKCPRYKDCTECIIDIEPSERFTPGAAYYDIFEILYDSSGMPRALITVDGGLFGYCSDTKMIDFFEWVENVNNISTIKKLEGNMEKMYRRLTEDCIVE